MINTYQTSMALPQVPPPVPPRLGRPEPILIPTQLPSAGYSKPLLRFLVCVVTLHLFLSVGGFLYLYYNERQIAHATYSSPQGRVGFPPVEKQDTTYRAFARMLIGKPNATIEKKSGYLEWRMDLSVRKNINYYGKSWLTVLEPGDYLVYSRVTFSKHSIAPLTGCIKLKNMETGAEKEVAKAHCSLSDKDGLNPQLCTVTLQDVITLSRGNQLSVWVENLSLVDYGKQSTSFGMYKL
ncbi:CD40 ligand [Poecilia latipinna]|uniref:CD40 ligand n=1 Tax=Poecilia formosa TaxID=48698 RepID=A0A087Y655_POEFO|nr:PREDICTED: tumor necrosis factor ligand superfamily member 6-like [Poecilia formosa]XP_014885130.1 PREDICTED: tumor necrosis factor ligand superfamily member 6-like [Poecilia latipinna]